MLKRALRSIVSAQATLLYALMARPRLFLIDTFGYVFRAYHARARSGAPPMRTSTGISTEAVYIFHNMLRKLRATYNPEYWAAIFESSAPTFRSEAFAEYKANRAEMPEDLAEQLQLIRELLEALRVPVIQSQGFEADDVIGGLARQAEQTGEVDVVIVSSDKDMLQLVTDHVHMFNPVKEDVWFDVQTTTQFMGVPPSAIPDVLALQGDAIDNIPGAPGIGEKGARELILRFGSVEAALERAAEVERKTYRESLQKWRDQILLSKKLATIDTSVPVKLCLEQLRVQEPDYQALKQIYKKLEFFSLLKELQLPEEAAVDARAFESQGEMEQWLAAIPAEAPVAVSFDGSQAGLSWKVGEGRAVAGDWLPALKAFMEAGERAKLAHDVKSVWLTCERLGWKPAGFRDDVMLEAFLLSADPAACACEVLVEKYLDRKLGESVAARAACVMELHQRLAPEVEARGLKRVYEEIDLPLIPVLVAMERTGIRVETSQLEALGRRMDAEMQRLAQRIWELAGHEFNINSPQQLGKVLYEELRLPAPVRYGKGKTQSTAADILETLAAEYEIARLVLEYRQVAKLKGTYVDALPALIRPDTGRVHTTYNQAGAATGRLSSSNPNLQNIPIRTELGREIRAAFVPEPGWMLVVADYSQIELRLLAHMSGDAVLTEAFRRGEDIHTRTAAEAFGVAPEQVTPEMRRLAKAVNFGIVYGQTPFGLAAQLGIDRKEAEAYIRAYFELYKGVKAFIERTLEEVRRSGVAKTMFGRERPIPDIRSKNANARAFAERTAINTPLQGTAADLIKLAMIRLHGELEKQGLRSRLLLQVHDELVLEAPGEEAQAVGELTRRVMEGVCELSVPLVVEIGVGPNWRDAK